MIKDKPYRYKRKNKNSFKRTIRRGDVVSVNGVGSIYSFKDHYSKSGNQDSLMLAGLSHWQQRMQESAIPSEWRIDEPRLKALLDKDYFVLPPDFRDESDDNRLNRRYLPYFRFPNWHYCPILSCGKMKYLGLTSEGNQKCSTGHKSEKSLVPMRFAVICKIGHIDDFPFFDWAHKKKDPIKNDTQKDNCDNRHLVYQAGKGGNNSISSVRINCSNCGASETLASAFMKQENINTFEKLNRNHTLCSGRRPWLGSESNDKCNNIPEVVLRNAIKVYYPVIKSSIYIPIDTDSERNIHEFLNDVNQWNRILKRIEDKDKLKIYLEGVLEDDKYAHLKFDDVFQGIVKKENNLKELNIETIKNTDEETYRFQEYNYIKDPRAKENSHLELSIKKKSIKEYGDLSKYFSNIFLVNRLTETRVQTGFTRSKPYEEGSDEKMIQQLTTDHSIKWLPATVVKGEGIFLEFNLKSIEEWESKFNFEHLNKIKTKYNDRRKTLDLNEQNIRNKYYLIHTFAHLLINQLSYSCGYGSSSLRERIYCNASSDENLMQGVLIYTASGDSEGSLGGLVREGQPTNLMRIIKKMINKAQVCSYDPVCLDHKAQGLNGTNASACHACSFLSETSCEQSNQLLDRTTIIGDSKYNSLGFFQDLIESS